ncbi:MAG: PadR family transcriptional regulator [Nanoarchaeota archaeon]|nr:PadR family transcriptional regulator [Nanoarchaeota archaeon]
MRPSERLKEKIEKENLWLFALSILKSGRMNARDLRGLVKKRFGFVYGNVTAYKVLYLLESGNYVKSEKAGKFVFYGITKKGLAELEEAKRLFRKYSAEIAI